MNTTTKTPTKFQTKCLRALFAARVTQDAAQVACSVRSSASAVGRAFAPLMAGRTEDAPLVRGFFSNGTWDMQESTRYVLTDAGRAALTTRAGE